MPLKLTVAARARRLTEQFRYDPPVQRPLNIFVWIRNGAVEAGLDPDRCALVTIDEGAWDMESTPTGQERRIFRRRVVILYDDDRAFRCNVITGGRGDLDSRDDHVTAWRHLNRDERRVLVDELTEGRKLLRGDVYFPPALFAIAYPPRHGTIPWGAILTATTPDHVERTAFRRDGTIETSPLPAMSLSASGIPRRVPEWIEDPYSFASEQASREKPLAQFRCPCCGYLTLMERGAFETCPVCWWEDDGQDDPHADEPSGPNHLTLTKARENFRTLGAMEARLVPYTRAPTAEEV
jgi:Cysteine-rich CPCC